MLAETFEHDCAVARTGGAIPFVSALHRHGVPTILTGVALSEDNIHAPNERLRVSNYEARRARRALPDPGARGPETVTRRLALGAALYALVIVAAFPTVAAMRRTFAPNGAVAGQMSQPTALAYPERARTPSTIDAGAFSWFFEPMTATAHRALAGGTVPLWNPYAGLGMPLVANAQSAVGSPLTLPVLAKPDQKVWNGVILFAAAGRGRRLSRPAAAARRDAARRDGRRAAVRPRADVHALGAAGVVVGRGARAVAAGGDPGARAPAGPAAVRGGGAGRRRGGLRRAAGGARVPGVPRRRLGPLLVVARGPLAAACCSSSSAPRCVRALLAAPQVVPTLEYLRISADSHGGTLGDTRLALGDLDALVRRKGLQPELLGWPLAIAAVAGAIGWRRRIPGTGILLRRGRRVGACGASTRRSPRCSRGSPASTR